MKVNSIITLLSIVSVLASCNRYDNSDSSISQAPVQLDTLSESESTSIVEETPSLPTQGALIISREIVADDNLNYFCKIKIANKSKKKITGLELIDYMPNGGPPTTFNLMQSIKHLSKIKIQILPNGEAAKRFHVLSSNVNPEIAKIFYKDGTIEATMFDINAD
jgi:hypothetical protein